VPPPERSNRLLILWSWRVVPGMSFYVSHGTTTRFDFDVTSGLALLLSPADRLFLGIIPEFGYTFHGGDVARGHYLTAGLNLELGTFGVLGVLFVNFLVGERVDRLDLGIRYGLRVACCVGMIGLEVSHEQRFADVGDVESVRLLLSLDVGLALSALLRRAREARGDLLPVRW
jgi:hypothetical protein